MRGPAFFDPTALFHNHESFQVAAESRKAQIEYGLWKSALPVRISEERERAAGTFQRAEDGGTDELKRLQRIDPVNVGTDRLPYPFDLERANPIPAVAYESRLPDGKYHIASGLDVDQKPPRYD